MPWAKRILFKTALTPFTGYGNDGIGLALTLSRAGYDVTLLPTSVQPPLPAPVAALLTRPIEPPYDVLLNHADPSSLGLSEGERRSARQKIAWTMWEYTDLGSGFDKPFGPPGEERSIEDRLDSYDTVLVYDEVSRQAIEPRTSAKVEKLQGGYFADDWKTDTRQRDWWGTFRFCMVGQLHDRKNPWVAVAAFKKLRAKHPDWDVEFHLKNNIKSLHPKMEEAYGVKIHYETWTQRQLLDFYLSCHCLLAPSWGEGKNLPALEAMTTGIPVIATEFGGHAEWMPVVGAYDVKHTLEAHDAEGRMLSARADVDDLVAQMEHVYENREEAIKKGRIAADTVPAMMDWSKVVDRLGKHFV